MEIYVPASVTGNDRSDWLATDDVSIMDDDEDSKFSIILQEAIFTRRQLTLE